MDISVIFLFAMIIGSANCIITDDDGFTRTIHIYPTDPNNGATRFAITDRGQNIVLNDAWEDRFHRRHHFAQDFFDGGFVQLLLNNAITEDPLWTHQAINGNRVQYTRHVELPLELPVPGRPVVTQKTMTLQQFLDLSGLQRAHVPFFFSKYKDSHVTRADLARMITFSVEYHATLGHRLDRNRQPENISHHTLVFRFHIQ